MINIIMRPRRDAEFLRAPERLLRPMWWKILGRKTAAVGIGMAFNEEIRARSAKREDKERFLKLLDAAEDSYFFDTWKEIHVFMYKFPFDVTKEDLAFAQDMIEKIIDSSTDIVVDLDGKAQVYTVVLTAAEDTDLYKYRRENRETILKAWETHAKESGLGPKEDTEEG